MPSFSLDPYSPGLLLAFAAGVVNTLSPCCLAMTPAFLAHVTGTAAGTAGTGRRQGVLAHTAAYLAGFSSVFILIGLSASLLGYLLIDMRPLLWKAGGALVIALGFHQAGIIRIAPLMRGAVLSPVAGGMPGLS